ncbi:ABC transporter permease [Cellulomonas sp. KRMCY2]|uniref:ABC transporter permease n=1 Tax=Cellulomonas sp. KRMCY2 TaxID=1304865 RepID=UPI0004A275BE|nr:ABC transporter permease [Cellulomonas sp. KRMCY2]
MRPLWIMTASDLRQHVRDRSVVIFALIVPLALMLVFNVTFVGSQDVELDEITVAWSAPADDELAAHVLDAALGLDAIFVRSMPMVAGEVRAAVESGEAALGVVVPEGFTAAVTSGEAVVVEVVQGEDGGIETAVVISVMQSVLDQLAAGTVAATAGAQLGLPAEQLAAIAQTAATAGPAITLTEGRASAEQLSGSASLVAGQAALFLLFTAGFGVLGLVAEREQGTLARLRSMPMRRGLVVAAKGLGSYILGVVATTVLLVVGSRLFDVSFGSPAAVAVLVLCVVASAVSLMFVIARVARTAEQASIVQSILALVLGMAGGSFFPITGSGLAGLLLDLNPIAAFLRGLGITYGGGGLGAIGTPVLIMLGFAVVCGAASRLVPDRGGDR